MKRIIWILAVGFIASFMMAPSGAAGTPPKRVASAGHVSAAANEAAHLNALKLLAPADEYFGPLKVSILGIRNELRDIGLRYDVNHDSAHQQVTMAELIEKSIRDWEHRYPHDGGVPHSIYFLQRLYAHILSVESREKAQTTAKWLFADYPTSSQARTLHHVMVTEQLPPLAASTALPNAPTQGTYTSVFGPAYTTRMGGTTAPGPAATATNHP